MPWKLTTPVNVGDLDANPYQEIRLTRMLHDSVRKVLVLDLEYGNTVDGNWVAGMVPRGKITNVTVDGPAYLAMVGGSYPQEGERTYTAVQRTLYAALATMGVIGSGHVE